MTKGNFIKNSLTLTLLFFVSVNSVYADRIPDEVREARLVAYLFYIEANPAPDFNEHKDCGLKCQRGKIALRNLLEYAENNGYNIRTNVYDDFEKIFPKANTKDKFTQRLRTSKAQTRISALHVLQRFQKDYPDKVFHVHLVESFEEPRRLRGDIGLAHDFGEGSINILRHDAGEVLRLGRLASSLGDLH